MSQVALDGLDNILKIGELDKESAGAGAFNQYAVYIEEAGGMVSTWWYSFVPECSC